MLVAVLLICAAVAYRLVLAFTGGQHDIGAWNFAPLAAISLCGGIYLPRRLAAIVPLSILLISDLLLNFHYGVPLFHGEIVVRYVALGLVVVLGLIIRKHPALWRVLAASVAGSTLFYILTNTGSWLFSPIYARTFSGWLQALTVGEPGWPSTTLFFRNSVVSDLLFTLLFVASCQFAKSRSVETTEPSEPEPVH